MKHLFKICCLLFVTASSVYGQEVIILDKSYNIKPQRALNFDLQNFAVTLEPSPDDKVHISHTANFSKYSKQEQESYINNQKISITQDEDGLGNLKLKTNDNSRLDFVKSVLEMVNKNRGTKTDSIRRRKTLDSMVLQLDEGYLATVRKLSNSLKKQKPKKFKMVASQFIVKVPTNIKVNIIGVNTQCILNNLDNVIELKIERGGLIIDSVCNNKSKFYIKDAFFNAKTINGGKFSFNDVYRGRIRAITNVNIRSDFSTLEFDKIGEYVSITDFNSKLWFYDFSEDFKDFNLKSEYSKIHLFHPKTDFSLTAMGNNAINIKIHYPNKEIVGGTATADVLYKMITHKAKGIGKFSGDIQLEIDNGIIHIYKNENKK